MYNAPPDSSSPKSINNQQDIDASTAAVRAHLLTPTPSFLQPYHAVLVACYSAHPLVQLIATACPDLAVTGIFEASIAATLPLLQQPHSPGWGIVTTGAFWDAHLTAAVHGFLGCTAPDSSNAAFRGVFTTGLDAGDFHGPAAVGPGEVERRLRDAARALLRAGGGGVGCVVMGCASMAGLEGIIRAVAVEEYGAERAAGVFVVDGVRAGVGVSEGMVRNRRMFLG